MIAISSHITNIVCDFHLTNELSLLSWHGRAMQKVCHISSITNLAVGLGECVTERLLYFTNHMTCRIATLLMGSREDMLTSRVDAYFLSVLRQPFPSNFMRKQHACRQFESVLSLIEVKQQTLWWNYSAFCKELYADPPEIEFWEQLRGKYITIVRKLGLSAVIMASLQKQHAKDPYQALSYHDLPQELILRKERCVHFGLVMKNGRTRPIVLSFDLTTKRIRCISFVLRDGILVQKETSVRNMLDYLRCAHKYKGRWVRIIEDACFFCYK